MLRAYCPVCEATLNIQRASACESCDTLICNRCLVVAEGSTLCKPCMEEKQQPLPSLKR